ncbi:MAG TPA: hypothetical protein VHU92_09960 [Streptosporangiaceae bacterium]|jgi:hypothetical protein|nr:hypothetical protein [Streptosporangiaceae bacterium]
MTGRVRALLGCGIAAASVLAALASPALATGIVTPAAGGAWGRANALGMTGALSSSEGVGMVMSCGAAGYCTVAGTVAQSTGDVVHETAAFRASETRGTWGRATKITGFSALGGRAPSPAAVSCPSAGSCLIGGKYVRDGRTRPWVAAEVHGSWHAAAELPGTAALNGIRKARITSVSCPAAGDCLVGGSYTDAAKHQQAFVSSQADGTWGTPVELPGTGALNSGGAASVSQVSCASPGNCAAVGSYSAAKPHVLAFVATEVNGTWRAAISVPGLAALHAQDAQFASVSCASPGNCAAVGSFNEDLPLAVSEVHGTWESALALRSPAGALPPGQAETVACVGGGHCAAGGFYYTDHAGHTQAFIATASDGSWGQERQVPGIARLGTDAQTLSLSCAAPGDCAAGGFYRGPGPVHRQAFVASEANGTWGSAQEVPGSGRLNQNRTGAGQTSVVSCRGAQRCALAGGYTARRLLNPFWVFVDSQR